MPPRPRPEPSNNRRPARPAKGRPQTRRAGGPARPGRRPDQVPEARGGRILQPLNPDAETENDDTGDADTMRLQKFLAMAGVDSRRNCEEYIRTGRVTVNSEVVTDPARGVDPRTQDIRLDSERLRMPRFRYFLVNKPKGVLCTNHDPMGRPRAVDLVPVSEQRMFTVGRLDENTEGMLLITNDGDLAQKLAHPRFEVIRRYRCHVAGIPQPDTLNQLRDGMYFAEGYFKFRSVHIYQRKGQSAILELELQEGKNREIRRLMARVGHKVLNLERVAFGPLQLGNLAPGRHRELQPFEIHELRHFAEHGEKPAARSSKPNEKFGYRSGQTRGKRRGATPGNDRSANRERTPQAERSPAVDRGPSVNRTPSVDPSAPGSDRAPVRERPPGREAVVVRRSPVSRETTPDRERRPSGPGRERLPSGGRALSRERAPDRPAAPKREAFRGNERGAERAPQRERGPARERGPQRDRAPQRDLEDFASRERSPRPDAGEESPRASVRRPAAPRPSEPRNFEPRAAGKKPSSGKPAAGRSGAARSGAGKSGGAKSGAKKSGAKKSFRPATGKPASAAINKGRDRRKSR